MKLQELVEPSFGLDDIPDEPVGYGSPPRRSQFRRSGDGGQGRNTGLASVTRRNTIALRRMAYWGAAQERPDGRTVLQTVVQRMWDDAIEGDPISQRLLFDVMSPASAKQLLTHELESQSGDGLATIIIRDMTRQDPPDSKTLAAEAGLRVEESGGRDPGAEAMRAAASAAPPDVFDSDLEAEFEKATEGREPIEEWDEDSRAEAARLLKLNPETVPDPNGSDPRKQRYRPGPKELAEMNESERCVREFFERARTNKEK